MSIISIGIPIPDRSALPGQTGSGEEVNLQYATQNYCKLNGTTNPPTVATPSGGTFSSSDNVGLAVVPSTGIFNVGDSDPGNYTITYTVAGVGSANFPINIGAVINTTITGDSATCIGSAPSPADLTAVSGYSNYEWFKDNVSVQNGASNTYTPAFNVAGNFVYKVTITDNSLSTPCIATSSNFTFTVNSLPTISIAGGNFCSGSTSTLTATASSGTAFVWELDTGSGFNVISGQTNSTISVSTVGEYRAKVTDTNGCTSAYSNTLSIAQFASPSVTITTVPGTTICTGDTATLTANPTGGSGSGYTYLWSTSATTQAISVTTSGTYTVTVTDSNGCTATASQAIAASTAATAIASINNDAAMTFNGTDQYIDLGTPAVLNLTQNMSISAWINTNTIALGTRVIICDCNTPTSQSQFCLEINRTAGKISALANGQNVALTGSTTLSINTWHHVALTRSGSTGNWNYVIYLDGVVDGSVNTSDNPSSQQGVAIGRFGKDSSGYFSGKIDEVAVWNSVLSSCDIKGIYEGSIGSNASKAANLLDANTTIPAPVYWNRMGDS